MRKKDDEETRLRSVALQNAGSILAERQRVENELAAERERLRITLASIGDGVISTDARGKVTYLNRVAERLTGWAQAEAAGRELCDVFRIINEQTREPVENPALRALAEGRIVGLANHTVLVARDGAERPIDDSAAPMRDAAGATIGAVLVFRDVTEKRAAEEARARLAAIVESSEDAIVSKTLQGIIRSWNAGAERLFGYTREEVVGQSITLLIPPERLDEERKILERLGRGERIEHFETVRVTKEGRRIDISLTISPIKDREGRIIGASKIARDITEHTRAEQALRESEERHRFLANLAISTQALADPAEVMAATARMLAEHLGAARCAYADVEDEKVFVVTGNYTAGVSSMVGRWPVAAFGPEVERCMLANEPFVIDDVDSDPRAGSDLTAYRETQIRAAICLPLHKAGTFVGAMAVHQQTPRHWTATEIELVRSVAARCWESIERTRVARGLQETADRLTLALSAASLGAWSWDAQSDIVTFSPRAAEIFGIPPGPHTTWTRMRELLHEDDRQRVRLAIEEALATQEQYDVEYPVVRPDGAEIWVAARGRAQYDAGGKALGMYGVLLDITERKQLEQELRRRAEELAEAGRRKDEFLATLAHELRNPLAPIRTGLELLRMAGNDPAVIEDVRSTMEAQALQLVRLVDDLMDVSRITSGKVTLRKGRVDLASVVRTAVDATRSLILEAGHELDVRLPPEPIIVEADITRLAQILSNLLTNAAKYTEGRGRIWLTAERQGGDAVVVVRDTGVGIPAEMLESIFEMFRQVDQSLERSHGGLGIGLTLVKRLVEMHGGSVEARSDGPGRGSEFIIRLPIVTEQVPEPRPDDGESVAQPGKLRVLIVDDNKDAARMLGLVVRMMGCVVRTAHDGLEALEVAAEFQPDVVLMDLGMPRMNGYDAAREMRRRTWDRDVLLVALTGWGQEEDRQRTRAAGFDCHLVKPVEPAALRKLLAERQPKSDS